jgi:redox-sensitive bicupin YhaK (pirin superfamily)
MKKRISFTGKGQRADIGDMTIYRILPNRYADAVGSFVFLDHLAPKLQTSANKGGTGSHPHRGIATLSYIINGEDEHFDSAGNYAKVHSGGVQWMKAGNGIIHDESLSYDTKSDSKLTHGFQFWINLPSKIKAEKPEYLAIQGNEVPQKMLPAESGWIKVIVGNYEELSSKIPNYMEQFIYHIHLEAGKQFSVNMADKIEVAAFLPTQNATINDAEHDAGEFVEFDRNAGIIEIINTSNSAIDVLLFGGEKYTEPIVAEGPFVMNSSAEIADAYRDFYNGKYGKIDYNVAK